METHTVVSHHEWLAQRARLLEAEKAFTRERDRLASQRRNLPWEPVDKEYVFAGPSGPLGLADLFDTCGQLVVYHFMFAPDWDAGCPHCSFWADKFDGIDTHLSHRDTRLVAVSRAPYPKIAAYRERMGWSFRWYSSADTSFNADYGVYFAPDHVEEKVYNYGTLEPGMEDREGISAFVRGGGGRVFHTYSTYARGIDIVNAAYNVLDLTAKGRDEGSEPQSWVRRHDEYGG